MYLDQIKSLSWEKVLIHTAWLEAEDYPKVLLIALDESIIFIFLALGLCGCWCLPSHFHFRLGFAYEGFFIPSNQKLKAYKGGGYVWLWIASAGQTVCSDR
jgi:hypothetical protein